MLDINLYIDTLLVSNQLVIAFTIFDINLYIDTLLMLNQLVIAFTIFSIMFYFCLNMHPKS